LGLRRRSRLGDKTLAERGWERLAWCDERLAFGKVTEVCRCLFLFTTMAATIARRWRDSSPV
jgi:hypothetical protein